MRPFWREKDLTEDEEILLNAVYSAHSRSALRDNSSSTALKIAAASTGSLSKALIGALSTLGGRHAPLEKTYELLELQNPEEEVMFILQDGSKVPGWGNSFHKTPDPLWADVAFLMEKHFPEYSAKIESITDLLHQQGKRIYPNPSCYTAMTALILGIPKESAEYLFIAGRLYNWTLIFHDNH